MMRTVLVSVLVALTVAVPLAGAEAPDVTAEDVRESCEPRTQGHAASARAAAHGGPGPNGTVRFTADLFGVGAEFVFCVVDDSDSVVFRHLEMITGQKTYEVDVPVRVGNYTAMMALEGSTSQVAGSVGLSLAECVDYVGAASANAHSTPLGAGITISGECPFGGRNDTAGGGHGTHGGSGGNATASGGHGTQGGFFGGAVAGATDPRTAVAASLAGLAGLIALGLAKWSIARVMLLGAFSRISRPEALDQEARAAIHDFIRENPGAEVPRIMEAVGTKNGQTNYHLAVLRREDLISVVRQGRTDHHFERGRFSPADMKKIATLRNTTVRQVFETIRRMPDASVGELAVTLGVSQATVSKAVKRLQDAGLVDSRRRGRRLELTSLPAPLVA